MNKRKYNKSNIGKGATVCVDVKGRTILATVLEVRNNFYIIADIFSGKVTTINKDNKTLCLKEE